MRHRVTRRTFLETSGRTAMGAAAGLALSSSRTFAAGVNERLRVGLIGCGGMGNANKDSFMRAEQVELAALCDVDRSRLDKTAAEVEKKTGRRPAVFEDYRKLYWGPVKESCFQNAAHKMADEEANRPLGREYRKGYELPAV